MSFIQFESASDKEKIRQELREAREQLLETAKQKADKRAAEKQLSDLKWMHPAVALKIQKQSKMSEKEGKKPTKKKKKNRSHHSDSDQDSKSHKKSKKSKKKRKRKHSKSSSEEEQSSENETWVERPTTTEANKSEKVERDGWMTDNTLLLKTFSREKVQKDVNKNQQTNTYDPKTNTRELNPYWKIGTGTGLPAFQKPTIEIDDEYMVHSRRQCGSQIVPSTGRNWQKKAPKGTSENLSNSNIRAKDTSSSSSSEDEKDDIGAKPVSKPVSKPVPSTVNFLTNQQMNELGAKIVKAEIMGNQVLASQLKATLENARAERATNQGRDTGENITEKQHILLTHTDERGNSRPLAQALSAVEPREYSDRSGRKRQKQKRVETHVGADRVRYFADDDRYDIKQMFEREKYATAADSNWQFADIAAKHKNPNDDLEDIFADKIRENISETDKDKRELQRAVHEHHRLTTQLENCKRCFDSDKMNKQLLVALGDKVYLALSSYTALQSGHCVIVPTQHVSCCTQLDEDQWSEINDFRKALTRMFMAQRKDVIFFEIANKLQRRPHLSIHCVPIPKAEGELAPFYFKKAIEESEYEWSVNKQLVSLKGKNLRSCIPKGLPYFWVNFGMDDGFAHVIEDQSRFPATFAQEIICGMLRLDVSKWRKPQKESNIIAKVKNFVESWKEYDCTNN